MRLPHGRLSTIWMVFLLLNVAEPVTLNGIANAVSFALPESMQFLITVECTTEVVVEFQIKGKRPNNVLMTAQFRSKAGVQTGQVEISSACNEGAFDWYFIIRANINITTLVPESRRFIIHSATIIEAM